MHHQGFRGWQVCQPPWPIDEERGGDDGITCWTVAFIRETVARYAHSGVIAAGIMCVFEIICAPLYLAMAPQKSIALIPWAAVACLLAVGFTYTVGFALLWIADVLGNRVRERLSPLVFGAVGMVGFLIWGFSVLPSIFDSLVNPLGGASLAGSQLWAVAFNCAVIGFVSFALARFLSPRAVTRVKAMTTIAVITVLLAALGIFYLYAMYSQLY